VIRPPQLAAGVAAALCLALHLPFLPPALEDLDSINFALGVRHFDVAQHQPHPPGYPLYIAAAKAVNQVVMPEVRALSLLSVIAGALALAGLFWFFSELDSGGEDPVVTGLAAVCAAVSPLFWITAARPLSDVPGLAATIAIQALVLSARTPRRLAAAAMAAAFAAGIRSQVVWLTLPLLLFAVVRLRASLGWPARGRILLAYGIGGLLWFVPLIVISGGPARYLSALFNQGAEDLTGVKMLATTPTPGQLITAFDTGFLAPWGPPAFGWTMVALAAAGLVVTWRRTRHVAIVLLVTFGPYLLFDRFFQENITTRYALPLVIPAAYLAVRAVFALGRTGGVAAAAALIGFCVYVDDRAIYQYSQMEAPAFRMLADMRAAAAASPPPPSPILAMHRKEYFDMRRPIAWLGAQMPPVAAALPSPPKHEWLELVKYWNGGGRAPVWFVADPLRSDLALIRDSSRPTLYRWPLQWPKLIGGVRPNVMDWHAIPAPDWYLGEGWALTPETAGIAKEDRRGPGFAPISGWIRKWRQPSTLLVGGRNLGLSGAPGRLQVSVDGNVVDELTVSPGFFLRLITLPPLSGPGDYSIVTISSDNPDLAVEQFDAQPLGQVVFGFGEGWNEQEYNPVTGALWRWSSERAVLRVRSGGRAVALTLRGEIEEAASTRITIRVGDRVAGAFEAGRQFERTVLIPADLLAADDSVVAIESSAWYVPAETRWRSGDRRRLALKLYDCRVTPVS
jgi:hypothetical protein